MADKVVRTVVALPTRAEAALEVPLTGLGVQRRVIGHSALHLQREVVKQG